MNIIIDIDTFLLNVTAVPDAAVTVCVPAVFAKKVVLTVSAKMVLSKIFLNFLIVFLSHKW